MPKIRIKPTLIHSLIFAVTLTVSCKERNPANNSASEFKGSISQSPPGGTLATRNLNNISCNAFKDATWYRMSRPVGAMIWHQYIGVRISWSDTKEEEFQTSGLSAPDDLPNLKSWWAAKGESNQFAHMIGSKRYTDCAAFLKSATRVNTAMATSCYQNAGIRVLAMVIAPVPVLGGRPCARQAKEATGTWLTATDNTTTESEYCNHCTEIVPGASWSKNSVDWDESAFIDAATSNSK